jgi:hypothetical protein
MKSFIRLLKAGGWSPGILLCCLGLFLFSVPYPRSACGNNSAVAVGVGGIQLIRQELVAMEKEELSISMDKVTVAYEFRNTSDRDITTEVAFPIPEFGYPCMDPNQNHRFDDFKVFVDGNPVLYETEIKAMVKGKDVTSILAEHAIRPETFGGYICDILYGGSNYSVNSLSAEKIKRLKELGIISEDEHYPYPLWSVFIKYHWNQTFPAHKIVSIRHEYKPLIGYHLISPNKILEEHPDSCVDASDIRNFNLSEGDIPSLPVSWIKYILTTANSWKTPINDFTLRLKPLKDSREEAQIKFCWDGPVEWNDKGEATVHMKNFLPQKDLVVFFFGSPIK